MTISLGNCICPKCGNKGRLKKDIRQSTTRYFVSHSEKLSRRYPYYGKYLYACYLGISGSFDIDLCYIKKVNTSNGVRWSFIKK